MMGTLFDMTGRVAIVTGSTKGMGRDIAARLVQHGAQVAVSSRAQADCADVHLKNRYITGSGNMGLSDWQNCCIGHWGRDLACAMTTLLAIKDRRAWERELVALYIDRLAAHGVPAIPFDGAFTIYRQQTFSALAYRTSTLCPPDDWADMQPSHTSTAFISRIATAIDDLDSLDTVA